MLYAHVLLGVGSGLALAAYQVNKEAEYAAGALNAENNDTGAVLAVTAAAVIVFTAVVFLIMISMKSVPGWMVTGTVLLAAAGLALGLAGAALIYDATMVAGEQQAVAQANDLLIAAFVLLSIGGLSVLNWVILGYIMRHAPTMSKFIGAPVSRK